MPPARNRATQDEPKDVKDRTGAGVTKGRKNAANNREAKAEAAAAASAEASTSQAQASVCHVLQSCNNTTDILHCVAGMAERRCIYITTISQCLCSRDTTLLHIYPAPSYPLHSWDRSIITLDDTQRSEKKSAKGYFSYSRA
jgi:hypothetical protein